MAKVAFNKKKTFLTSKLDLNLRQKLLKFYIWRIAFMELKRGHFGKWITNTLKLSKCGLGEGWRRSVGLIVSEMNIHYLQSMCKVISDIK
jgi:hypothetical protein